VAQFVIIKLVFEYTVFAATKVQILVVTAEVFAKCVEVILVAPSFNVEDSGHAGTQITVLIGLGRVFCVVADGAQAYACGARYDEAAIGAESNRRSHKSACCENR